MVSASAECAPVSWLKAMDSSWTLIRLAPGFPHYDNGAGSLAAQARREAGVGGTGVKLLQHRTSMRSRVVAAALIAAVGVSFMVSCAGGGSVTTSASPRAAVATVSV